VLHPSSGSYLQAITHVADAQHGANIHGAAIDELHVHKTAAMVDVIESGTGSRTQPLVLIITTADEAVADSVYDRRHTLIEQLADGIVKDPAQFGVIWRADEEDDPYVESTWRKANPGYGISPTAAYMRGAAVKAQNSPADRPSFLRLHLNRRVKGTTKWLELPAWDACGQLVDASEWAGRLARGGLDLSTSSDLTAFVLKSGELVHALFWLPEDRIRPLERQTGMPLQAWAAAGWLSVTEGNVVDYAKVREDIETTVRKLGCQVVSIGYDPWNASETVQLLELSGFQMVPIRQGYATLSAPAKHLERLVTGSTPQAPLLRHGGNPILRWCADSVEVRQDDNGNIKPVKPDRVKSARRIDGIVALIMAAREEMLGEVEESAAANYLEAMMAARKGAS